MKANFIKIPDQHHIIRSPAQHKQIPSMKLFNPLPFGNRKMLKKWNTIGNDTHPQTEAENKEMQL